MTLTFPSSPASSKRKQTHHTSICYNLGTRQTAMPTIKTSGTQSYHCHFTKMWMCGFHRSNTDFTGLNTP